MASNQGKFKPRSCALQPPALGLREGGVSSVHVTSGRACGQDIFGWPYMQTACRVGPEVPGGLSLCLHSSLQDATLTPISICLSKHSQHPLTCTICVLPSSLYLMAGRWAGVAQTVSSGVRWMEFYVKSFPY